MSLREHLEAIIVRGYCPTKEDDRADAIAALAILKAASEDNRWAAFTTLEIQSLRDAISGDIWGTHLGLIEPEIKAELLRREAA